MGTPRAATGPDGAFAVASRRRSLVTVLVIVFIDLLGFGVIIPILPFYVRSFGVSDVFIGLLAASYSLTQFVFAPVLGRLSDQRGRRPVLMLSVLGSVLAWTVFGFGGEVGQVFGTTGAIATLFASRMLAGAMGGNIATAQAYIADITPPADRAGALGLVGATFGLGFVFGPALGAAAASDSAVSLARTALPAFVPTTAYALPSFLAAGLSLVAFVAAALFLPEPNRRRTPPGRGGIVAQFRDALADPDLRPLILVFLVVSIAFSGVQVAFIPYVADVYGYAEAQAGLLLTYIGVLGVLNQGLLVRALSRRFGDARLAIGGAVLLLVALVAIPLAPVIGPVILPSLAGASPELVALLLVLALLSSGNSFLNVGTAAMVSTAATEDTQGSAFGVTQGAGSLGRTVGPPVMTAIYVLVYWAPFLLGAALTVAVVAWLGAIAAGALDDADGTAP